MTPKTEETLAQYLTLRLIIGFLGEKPQCNWWDTNFLSSTGRQFMGFNFPRTALAAGCSSVTVAAKRLHDERIGKGNVYHLFRLPSAAEEALHHRLLSADAGEFGQYLASQQEALGRLASLSQESVVVPGGPVQIGSAKQMFTDSATVSLARHYHAGFQAGKMVFPYFTND